MKNQQLQELRDYYDNTDMSDHISEATLDDRVTDEVMVSTSIRLPQSLVKKVRAKAKKAGIPATTLMRQWVEERIEVETAEAAPDDALIPASALMNLIGQYHVHGFRPVLDAGTILPKVQLATHSGDRETRPY